MYKLLPNDWQGNPATCIQRLSDKAWIPNDTDNMDFVEYNKWLSEGNIPLPPDEPTLP